MVLSKTPEDALGWLTGWSAARAIASPRECLMRDRKYAGVGEGVRRRLVEEDSTLDGFAADGALAHSVPAQLAGAVAAHEDHVLQPVQTHGTHGLQVDKEQRSAFGPQRRRRSIMIHKDLTCSLMS